MKRAAIAANLGGELTASCKRTRTAVRAAHAWYRKGRRGSPVLIISQWRILPKVLTFRETALFTKQVVEKLEDTEYLKLQSALMMQPDLGDLIPSRGGLRKW